MSEDIKPYNEHSPNIIPDWLILKDFEQWKLRMKNGRGTDERSTEGEGGIVFKAYNNVRILVERYPFNHLLREQAIWAIRHPNRKMPESDCDYRLAPPMLLEMEL